MFEKRPAVRVGRYFAKPAGGTLTPDVGRRLFLVPELIVRPYACNVPEQEKFVSLLAAAVGVNVAEVLLPHEHDIPLPPGCAYWCRDAGTYRSSELPQRSREQANAHLFVLAVLLREWDDCPSNRAEVDGVPVAYDFGDACNPNLERIEAFAQALKVPHPGGHYADTTVYIYGFEPHRRGELDAALAAFAELTSREIERLGDESAASGACPEVLLHVLRAHRSLEKDVARLFSLFAP